MPNPWEKYAVSQPVPEPTKPWERYGAPPPAAPSTPFKADMLGTGEITPQGAAKGMTSGDRLFGEHPLTDTLSVAGSHLKNLVTGIPNAFLSGPQNAEEAREKGTAATSGPMNVLGQLGLGAARLLVNPILDPLKQAVSQAKVGNYNGASYDANGNYKPSMLSSLSDAIPIAGPEARGIENDANKHGALPALLGGGIDLLGAKAGEILANPAEAIRKPFVGALDETIPGTSTTPRARYDAAKRVGVNLDLADATNSTLASGLKHIGRDSLAGSGVYEKAKTNNVSSLGNATDAALSDMSPLDREAGGVRLQDLLKSNQKSLHDAANTGYQQIDSAYGKAPITNPETLSSVADSITKAQAQHLREFPSLRPGKVGSVLDDAAQYGKPPVLPVKLSGLLDESGSPIPSVEQPKYTPPNVGDALKTRSGILDMYQNNPDLVKTASDAQLQRLVGATHDAVMDSLPDDAKGTLRDAQLKFKEMKETYDNPSSPFYDAVRTPNPTSKVAGIGPQTPESIRNVLGRVGEEGRGILQRGASEKMLGTAPGTENYNFSRFPSNLSKLASDYGHELFGDTHLGKLRDISDTSQALSRDFNPSGTAKQGQKLGEAAALIPTAGLPLLQYPLAKLMNSPKIVDFIMKHPEQAPALQNLVKFPAAATLLSKKSGTR